MARVGPRRQTVVGRVAPASQFAAFRFRPREVFQRHWRRVGGVVVWHAVRHQCLCLVFPLCSWLRQCLSFRCRPGEVRSAAGGGARERGGGGRRKAGGGPVGPAATADHGGGTRTPHQGSRRAVLRVAVSAQQRGSPFSAFSLADGSFHALGCGRRKAAEHPASGQPTGGAADTARAW